MKRTRIDDDGSHISKKRKVTEEVRFQFFEDLPDELLERILTMMFNAKYVRFVCHKWLGIVSNFSFLRSVCLQRWGEDSKLLKYEKSSPEKKIKMLEKYFIPLAKDDNGDAKVDWNRYYKIRSNYEKFLWLIKSRSSSKLKKAKLKIIIGCIHMGIIDKYPKVGYRALRFLCDLARMYIEAGNIAATECFVVQTWHYNDITTEKHIKYNTKMCACLFELYYIAKRNSVTHLQVSLILKIVNRFVRSSDRPQILAKLIKELPCLEPKILHDLQAWYASGLNRSGFSKDEKGMLITLPHVVQRTRDTLYDATKRLFDSSDDFEAKKSAIVTGMSIAEKKDPEFNRKLFRLVADLCPKEKFEEKSLPLLAKLATTFPHLFADEEYNILLELTLRRQKILLYDPIQQFYIASALLDSLNETRVQFFHEGDLRLLHQALTGHNLHDIATNEQTKNRIWLLSRLLAFEDRLIPYLPQYDRFFLEGQTSNPVLAARYLCDILGKVCPDQAVQRITSLIEQGVPNLGKIIAEGYDGIKTMLGDLWTIEYDKMVIQLLLDLFPEEKTSNIKLIKKKIDKKTVKGKWIFPIKDVSKIDFPWENSTKTQHKAMLLLMKYAKSHPMDRSTQIRILNIVLIYRKTFYYSAEEEFTELFLAMPILLGADIEDIAPQMLEMIAYDDCCNSEILLRLVNLHPCAVLIRLKQRNISGMNSIQNMAIIGCYYGIHAVDSRMSKEEQLEAVKKILLNKEPVSPTMKNILTHYAIQLRCAIFDPISTSYCAYRERDYWAVMKPALKDSLVEQWILQFIDDYDPETNFLKTMIPQYQKKKNH